MDDLRKFPRTRHLEGSNLQSGDADDRIMLRNVKGRYAVIEEKMDGANSGVSFSTAGDLLLQSRGHYLTGGSREKHFDLFKAWANLHVDQLFDRLGERYVMYGEWMRAKHTVFYDNLDDRFLEFDILDKRTGVFLSTTARRALLKDTVIKSVPVLYEGPMPGRLADLTDFIGPSTAKTAQWREHLLITCQRLGLDEERILRETCDKDLMEGVYVKFENDEVTEDRAKWVRHGFLQIILGNDTHWLSRPIVPNLLTTDLPDLRSARRIEHGSKP